MILLFQYAFYFLVVGAAIWASSWAEISCWMWTGERQTTKMRICYLESALNQDVRYFDTEMCTSDVVYAINADAVAVQDAISEKVRIHFCFFFSIIIPSSKHIYNSVRSVFFLLNLFSVG